MERLIRNVFLSVRMLLVLGLSFLGVAFTACTEDGTEDSFGPNGYKIIGTPTNKDRSANVQCDGRAQSISLVFNVAGDYVITTDGSEWLTIESGTEGLAGKSRGLKLMVDENEGESARKAEIYITIGDNSRCRLATVMQTAISIDAMVKWMDERLENEYYWLDKYNELKQKGEIDYDLTGSAFLKAALTGNKWGTGKNKVNKDDGYAYTDENGKPAWHLFSYLHQYAATKASTDASVNHGFGFKLYNTVLAYRNSPYYSFVLEHVYPSSPAAQAGLRRGDIIHQVNGEYINDYELAADLLLSPSSPTISVGRKQTNAAGESEIVTFSLKAGDYYESPVAYCGVLQENVEAGFDFQGKKIGYISYLTFDGDYDDELIAALDRLAKEGVTDLIIDLRNNGGGSVLSSSYFASMLLSEAYSDKEMVTLRRHEKNEDGDDVIPFVSEVEIDKKKVQLPHLNLQKVYFITSDGTASASEMLIMGLRAQGIEAVTVGKQTKGKDFGMDVITVQYGSSYYEFAPITFKNCFPNYDVDFSEGIAADIDFDALYNQVQDEYMQELLYWYPMPEQGAYWGNYLVDIGLGEAVANILGGTIFSTESASYRAAKTRASFGERAVRGATLELPQEMGMYIRKQEVEILER